MNNAHVQNAQSGVRFRFILVHGTFARFAEWSRSNSELAHYLVSAFPGSTASSFDWSGANSHEARHFAGQQLANHIRLVTAEEDPPIVLIGHSHGGNVMLQAVSALPEKTRERLASMVFLGTPFIHASARRISTMAAVLAAIAVFGLHGLILMLLALPTLGDVSWSYHKFYAAGLIILTVYRYFTASTKPDRRKLRIKLQGFLTRILEGRCRKRLARLPHQELPVRSLVCRIKGDEATVWLRLLTRLQELGRLPITLLGLLLARFWLFAVLAGLTALMLHLTGLSTEAIDSNLIMLISFGLVMGPLGLMAFLCGLALFSVLTRGHRFGFGWEGLLSSIYLNIHISAVPRVGNRTECAIREFSASNGRVGIARRHSIFYQDLGQWNAVINWLGGIKDLDINSLAIREIKPAFSRQAQSMAVLIIPILLATGAGWAGFDYDKWSSGETAKLIAISEARRTGNLIEKRLLEFQGPVPPGLLLTKPIDLSALDPASPHDGDARECRITGQAEGARGTLSLILSEEPVNVEKHMELMHMAPLQAVFARPFDEWHVKIEWAGPILQTADPETLASKRLLTVINTSENLADLTLKVDVLCFPIKKLVSGQE